MTDPISDMLTRIRNAKAVSKPEVSIPYSGLNYRIAKILEKENFLKKVEKKGRGIKKEIRVSLRYKDGQPAIKSLKRVSRPGQRIYVPAKKIRRVRWGYGISIVSTPKGLMTDREARKNHVGGEVIAEIW